MSEDSELERLKAKRLAEMQKNISTQNQPKPEPTEQKQEKPTLTPREIVATKLGFRADEVLQNAEAQFPNETKAVIGQLAQLISTGEFDETIDGGQLLSLFRTVGLNVRMNTKINVEQDGKFVSLSEKLHNKKSEEQ
ncbi:MAG: double-stranded DNA-binding protein [Nitrosopumilaceae archaeon]|uniref:Double-stranded DNA-binding protein n=2 Tax=Candidatus Nitrosomaritimum aestuariumsis TaxID=3342354 RepID=A0AC60W0Q6_9ARCH|nr:double-stranded DNA-binding protein [Nitrosopumilaceae archaeon]MBA4462279.1 double-stranded DNA-binding protein [Nitrosopumilaceae archaeon]MBA4462589.1 double-stranded DNA-binding protein [Nitrosopumilaceae archaeon]